MAKKKKKGRVRPEEEDAPWTYKVQPGVVFEEEEPDECGDDDEIALRYYAIRVIEQDCKCRHRRQLRF